MERLFFIIVTIILLNFSLGCGDSGMKLPAADSTVCDTVTALHNRYKEYFASYLANEILSGKNWKVIRDSSENFDFGVVFYSSPQFRYLLHHHNDAVIAFTADTTQEEINRVLEFALKYYTDAKDRPMIDSVKNDVRNYSGSDSTRIFDHIEMAEYYDSGDWEKYSRIATGYLTNFCWEDAPKLDWTANEFCIHVNDTTKLNTALRWSDRAIELNDIPLYHDTRAHLLYKLGRMDEAKEEIMQIDSDPKCESDIRMDADSLKKLLGK